MNIIRNFALTGLTCCVSLFACAQRTIEELENEIKSLSTAEEIKNYWLSLHSADQSVRGNVDVEKQIPVDLENFKRMILMLKHHGYPTGFCRGCNPKSEHQENFTPNMVFTHQRVHSIRELYAPVLIEAYEKGVASEFWYIHNLRGLVRSRYGRDFYSKKPENISKFLKLMEPYLNKEVNYDLTNIDRLNEEYWKETERITGSPMVFSKKKGRLTYNVHKAGDDFYLLVIYPPNGTFNKPQKIYYDPSDEQIKYNLLNAPLDTSIFNPASLEKLTEALKN